MDIKRNKINNKYITLFRMTQNYEHVWVGYNINTKNISISSWYGSKSQRQERYERAIEFVKELKINGCAICGYDKCIAALEFHHVNPKDKKFNMNMCSMAGRNITEELNKCILLCSNCHRELHYKEEGLRKK